MNGQSTTNNLLNLKKEKVYSYTLFGWVLYYSVDRTSCYQLKSYLLNWVKKSTKHLLNYEIAHALQEKKKDI